MGDRTSIEWTEASWNPIRAKSKVTGRTGTHCEILTPGCEHCYAQAINRRLGTGLQYLSRLRDDVEIYLDDRILTQPLRWKRPRRIFVCSMSDLFGEWVTEQMLVRICGIMSMAPQHTYQILTKRADRQRDFLIRNAPKAANKNWWFGVSVEDQRRADERIPVLLATPAAVRWISYEPGLGPIEICTSLPRNRDVLKGLDWVVIGGESGPGARPFNITWARQIIAQCAAAGVPVFMKQLGANPFRDLESGGWEGPRPKDRKGGDISEFPEDIRIREYPR